MISHHFFIRWYGIGILLMIIMVAVGGITRLTHSGLSIVEWKPITGVLPPLNDSDWSEEFEKYKKSPEFEKNKHFSIDNFKKIYFWEYIHRSLGRVIGLFFIIPLFLLIYQKRITREQIKSTLIIIFLIFFQGFLGWYMVKSGLKDDASVDPIRLMMHFLTAMMLVCYTYTQYLKHNRTFKSNKSFFSRNSIFIITQLIIIQIMYGAFTAGLEAGYIYRTFPLMDGSLIPANLFENRGIIENLFYNPASVQYIHRTMGTILLILAIYILLNRYKRKAYNSIDIKLASFIIFQFILGVASLLSNMNMFIAVMHQVNACLILLTCTQILYYHQINNKL